mgnify:CR=1 FL=1
MKIHTPPMTFKDDDAKVKWEGGLAKNQDSYGNGVYQFASEWATRMENALAADTTKVVSDVAKQQADAADDSGITGFMYGCAVGLLSDCWVHGEQLRRWSNKDVQMKDEGDKANETPGAVLNPALLTIS